MQLTHVRLLVSRFDECFRFYRDVMGLTPTWGEEGDGYADFAAGPTNLALFRRAAMADTVGTAALPVEAAAQDRVALILRVDDLGATVQQVETRGGAFVVGPTDHTDWGIRTAHLRDPDGNLIELYVELPKTEWAPELRDEAERYATA
jgi:catechol 2,3-dioxygenase-like lactoylglutathione lyase family enzyme